MKSTAFLKSIVLVLTTLLIGCGQGEKSTENTTVTSPVATQAEVPAADTPTPAESKPEEIAAESSQELTGEDKVANSDCLSCHMVERKVIGPSYQDVAAEYDNSEANVTMLAKKIIEGGVGVWGEVMMPPHPTLSEADAKDMVRYILSLQAH